MNYDDFIHNNPISTTSFSKEPFRNVRFLEEKIWVPWRIRDYRSRTLIFNDVFYPIAFYYHAVRNYTRDDFDLEFKVLDFKRCNETSMANHTDSFILDIELSKLFCVEMDYLNKSIAYILKYGMDVRTPSCSLQEFIYTVKNQMGKMSDFVVTFKK